MAARPATDPTRSPVLRGIKNPVRALWLAVFAALMLYDGVVGIRSGGPAILSLLVCAGLVGWFRYEVGRPAVIEIDRASLVYRREALQGIVAVWYGALLLGAVALTLLAGYRSATGFMTTPLGPYFGWGITLHLIWIAIISSVLYSLVVYGIRLKRLKPEPTATDRAIRAYADDPSEQNKRAVEQAFKRDQGKKRPKPKP